MKPKYRLKDIATYTIQALNYSLNKLNLPQLTPKQITCNRGYLKVDFTTDNNREFQLSTYLWTGDDVGEIFLVATIAFEILPHYLDIYFPLDYTTHYSDTLHFYFKNGARISVYIDYDDFILIRILDKNSDLFQEEVFSDIDEALEYFLLLAILVSDVCPHSHAGK